MSATLGEAVEQARAVLAMRIDGHLPRPERQAVLSTLGPDDPADAASHPRLVAQAAIVERALPVWLAERPGDDRPAALMRAALGSADELRAAIAWSRTFNDEIFDLYNVEPPISDEGGAAGHAAVALVAAASLGFGDGYDPGVEDRDIDPDLWSPEYWSEIALTTDDPAQNREERHALWTWWLDEAVPAAAQAGPRPGRSSTG